MLSSSDREGPTRADVASWIYAVSDAPRLPVVGACAMVFLSRPRRLVRCEIGGLAGCRVGHGLASETSVEVVAVLGQRVPQAYPRPSLALYLAVTVEGETLVMRSLFEPWRTRSSGEFGVSGFALLREACDPGWPVRGATADPVTEARLRGTSDQHDLWDLYARAARTLLRREGLAPQRLWGDWVREGVREAVAGEPVEGRRALIGMAGGLVTSGGIAVALLGIWREGRLDVVGGMGPTGTVWPLGGAWLHSGWVEAPWTGGTAGGSLIWTGGEPRLRRLQAVVR